MHGSIKHQAKHFFYSAGWKKFEPLWDVVIRARQLGAMTPVLEGVLSKVSRKDASIGGSHQRGPVAQLGARMNGIHEVTGSIPVWSTILRSREPHAKA